MISEGHPPGLENLKDLLLDVLVGRVLDELAQLLHELLRADLIMNQVPAVFDAGLYKLQVNVTKNV